MTGIKPTDAELEILKILWKKGPLTVKDVNEEVNQVRDDVGYTTTLKLMQIMAEKGLVTRDTGQRQHVYKVAVSEDQIQSGLLQTMIDRVFDGSAKDLILHALGQQQPSDEELAEIRKMLDTLNNKG